MCYVTWRECYVKIGVADATENDVNLHFDINVKGTILGTQAVLPHMLSK